MSPALQCLLMKKDVQNPYSLLPQVRKLTYAPAPTGQINKRDLNDGGDALRGSEVTRRCLPDASCGRWFDSASRAGKPFNLFTRVVARYGIRCEPQTIAAYSVHVGALTSEMFNADTIATLMTIFRRARDSGVLHESVMRRCQADWFHHFILGGAYRRLRAGEPRRAGAILDLFDLPQIRALGRSSRWRPIRWLFEMIVGLPPGLAATAMRAIGRASPERFWSSW